MGVIKSSVLATTLLLAGCRCAVFGCDVDVVQTGKPRHVLVGGVATAEDIARQRQREIEEERRRAYANDPPASPSNSDEVPTLSPIGTFGGATRPSGSHKCLTYVGCSDISGLDGSGSSRKRGEPQTVGSAL